MDDKIESIVLDKLSDISENQKETTECLNKLDKNFGMFTQKTEYELQRIREQDEKQNRILDEHIAGVNTLRDMHSLLKKDVDARFDKVEAPTKTFNYIVKLAGKIGMLASAIYGTLKLFGAF